MKNRNINYIILKINKINKYMNIKIIIDKNKINKSTIILIYIYFFLIYRIDIYIFFIINFKSI